MQKRSVQLKEENLILKRDYNIHATLEQRLNYVKMLSNEHKIDYNPNSGEVFVKAKIIFDVICVIISLVLSLIFFNFTIVGTREKTFISALLTGTVVKFFIGK